MATVPPTWKDQHVAATILNGGTKTSAIDLGKRRLCGVFLPAAFTGVTLTFEACPTIDGTFVPVKDGAGSSYSITVAQGQYIPVDPNKMMGVRYLKVVSGSSEGADRAIVLSGQNHDGGL